MGGKTSPIDDINFSGMYVYIYIASQLVHGIFWYVCIIIHTYVYVYIAS